MQIAGHRKRFAELTEREVLALAIASEEDDARIYRNWAGMLRGDYPATAAIFEGMAGEEDDHRRRLLDVFQARFGPDLPVIRREHIAGYFSRRPAWMMGTASLDAIRQEAALMEHDAAEFYARAAQASGDIATRKLLGDLAAAERGHGARATELAERHLTPDALAEEGAVAHRNFVLTWVQPGLAGLMDGSVSTLAPIFATAFATQDTGTTFLVGLAASLGAGISMGFTEAASDDGVVSGRGSPFKRGLASGVMTAVGGLGHALPYLIPHFWTATTIACLVVFVELWAIAWIQNRWMQTPFWRAALQVVVGGGLVFATGVLIGSG
ncbi:iron exporter MbfA [Paracoccus spongiarum]|uniref:Ferritin family protein n=1 Tax=Paracoccus spongiarum TaxID=3064387 RepID=A0ABT9JA52_9RHOB|nr:ferritin family protein [Paracoccus sp. 2205BS29-5]MDP5306696.1 ferritin family protein [Paracoccus sp. 2205BS29-5]